MHIRSLLLFTCLASFGTLAYAASDTVKDVQYYTESVLCRAKVFLPSSYSETGKLPAVVLTSQPRAKHPELEEYARGFAMRGLIAMTIGYRGWGECGGFLYFSDPIRWDDRLRFTQLTAKMRVRRGRVDPRAQVIDIRNAITFLQGQAGVDRARIGVWGADLAGGHAIVVAGSDARVKAIVAQAPLIAGKDQPRAAFAPSREQLADMVKLARTPPPAGVAAAKSMNEMEERLALAEYRPFWYLEQIRETTAVLFITAGKDAVVDNNAHAVPAAELLKGPVQVLSIALATHEFVGNDRATAIKAAADWFVKYL